MISRAASRRQNKALSVFQKLGTRHCPLLCSPALLAVSFIFTHLASHPCHKIAPSSRVLSGDPSIDRAVASTAANNVFAIDNVFPTLLRHGPMEAARRRNPCKSVNLRFSPARSPPPPPKGRPSPRFSAYDRLHSWSPASAISFPGPGSE